MVIVKKKNSWFLQFKMYWMATVKEVGDLILQSFQRLFFPLGPQEGHVWPGPLYSALTETSHYGGVSRYLLIYVRALILLPAQTRTENRAGTQWWKSENVISLCSLCQASLQLFNIYPLSRTIFHPRFDDKGSNLLSVRIKMYHLD